MGISNEELKSILPDIRKEFSVLTSDSFSEYEGKLGKAAAKSIDALQALIDDGTLSMDPEQLVKAVEVLTKSKTSIVDSKRRLIETLIKGEVMMRALEPPKDVKSNSVLEDYLLKQKKIEAVSDVNSIFSDIQKSE